MELAILRVEPTCNTTDKALLKNLEATKRRGFCPVAFTPSIERPPLLICGSGPSLRRYFPVVHKLYPHAHIMALNGAYKALQTEFGVVADYYAQLDARAENVNFFDVIDKKTDFLIASQCHPDIFEKLKDCDVQVYHLNTPTTKKVFQNEKIYYGGGVTVGSTAMGLAGGLGYRTIGILGYDSSYEENKSHIITQPQNAGQKTIDVWIDDRCYLTTACMAKQVEEFRPWVKELERTFQGMAVYLFGDGLLYDYILHGQRKEATRESEAAKYAEMYLSEDYRMPPHRAEGIRKILGDRPKGTLLDVGTGRGETQKIAAELGYTTMGTETVQSLLNEHTVHALLPTLPFEDKKFDTVTNFEVIEHLLPGDVVPALRELARVAKDRVIISAATRSDVRGGVELHPSYRSENEWEETFKAAWGAEAYVEKIGNLSSCGLSPVYEYRLRTS